jgi:glutaredoxin
MTDKPLRYVSERGHAFVVVGRPSCKFCVLATRLLDERGLGHAYVDLSQNPDERQRLIDAGFKTVPQIWHKGDHVGGYEDLQGYLDRLGFED